MASKENNMRERVCPICGAVYTEHPAISRTDNKTFICPDCGVAQALESIGVSEEEQREILYILHKYQRRNGDQ